MFEIEFEKENIIQSMYAKNTEEVIRIIGGIVINKKLESELVQWCKSAYFGKTYKNPKYKFNITCVADDAETNKFNNFKFLSTIARDISKRTGVEYEYIGEDNESLTWDFACGISYMKNNGGKDLFFALNDEDGKEIITISENNSIVFFNKVIKAISHYNAEKSNKEPRKLKYSTPNKEIINKLASAIQYLKVNNLSNEYHIRVYNDGCWWIDLERHPYGQIRFWVGFEDKRSGKVRSSLATVYRTLKTNELHYSVDGIIPKKAVKDKLLSLAVSLEKAGLITL